MNPLVQNQDESKFYSSLIDFLINTQKIKSNQRHKFQEISEEFYPLRFYKLVCRRGGFQAVTNRKEWIDISAQLNVTNIQKLKNFYCQYLYPYEQKYYFGKQYEENLPNIICGQPRKMIKTQKQPNTQTNIQINLQNPQVNPNMQNLDVNQQSSSLKQVNPSVLLQQQISKYYQSCQRQGQTFFLNKSKLSPSKSESKRIILGLQQFSSQSDTRYSLNLLLLYSSCQQNQFLFQSHQKTFNALVNFCQSKYPPSNEQQNIYLQTSLLIFRNFMINPINLKFILGTPLFQFFVKVFNQAKDQEASTYVVDIMNGLVKVGWHPNTIVQNLSNHILNHRLQNLKLNVELLRAIVDQREQTLFTIIPNHIQTFNRILINTQVSIEVKQQVFQIMAFVTDASLQARQSIAKNHCFLGIIVGILQNMKNHQKLTQLAALTLNNISISIVGKNLIKQFETELVTVGFSDDSLAGIIANILSDIATI